MAFSPDFLDELRTRLPLAAVVARRTPLKKRGREWTGLCPFHNEKSPSFTVNEDKGFYHCFGCGAHGDVIGFVMRTEGLSFPEAIERLAGEAGLEVPRADPAERAKAARRATLYSVLEAAARWYEDRLRATEGAAARDYLRGRGLERDAIARFRLGWAPDGGRRLVEALVGKDGVTLELLIEAGLAKRPSDGRAPYDFFRGRIIFPITDRTGRVIAFGARLLAGDGPKYINSAETALFDKGRSLYGYAQAREAIRTEGTVIVTEGYMDVIGLSLGGLGHAVAPLGTALTESQIETLWRLAPEPILSFDGDAAGERAAARAADRALPLLRPGFSLRFCWLPDGLDPDEAMRHLGSESVRQLLQTAEPLVDVLWRRATAALPRDPTPERRAQVRQSLDNLARTIRDPIVQAEFLAEFRRRADSLFGTGFRSPRASSRRFESQRGFFGSSRTPSLPVQNEKVSRLMDPASLQHRILLATLINHPSLIDEYGERLVHLSFRDRSHATLCREMLNASAEALDRERLVRHLTATEFARVLENILSDAVYAHAAFARPEAELAFARAGCDDVFTLIDQRRVRQEHRSLVHSLGEETNVTDPNHMTNKAKSP
ncbi:MAG: DNA primase [Alphaproteobacteria bacterium]